MSHNYLLQDTKKIENLKILNAKKCIPAGIIKVVNSKSPKDTKENQMNETHQTDLTDICTSTRKNFSETFPFDKSMDQCKHISNESSGTYSILNLLQRRK